MGHVHVSLLTMRMCDRYPCVHVRIHVPQYIESAQILELLCRLTARS